MLTVVRVEIKGRVATKIVVLHNRIANIEAGTACLQYEYNKMMAAQGNDQDNDDESLAVEDKKEATSKIVHQLELRKDDKPTLVWPGIEYEHEGCNPTRGTNPTVKEKKKTKRDRSEAAAAVEYELSERIVALVESMNGAQRANFGALVHDTQDRNWPAIVLDPRLFYSRVAYELLLDKPQNLLVLFLGEQPQRMFGSLRNATSYSTRTPMPGVSRRGIALAQELSHIDNFKARLIHALDASGFTLPASAKSPTTKKAATRMLKDNNTTITTAKHPQKHTTPSSIAAASYTTKRLSQGTTSKRARQDLTPYASKSSKKKPVLRRDFGDSDSIDVSHYDEENYF